jgi:hypothetical protein
MRRSRHVTEIETMIWEELDRLAPPEDGSGADWATVALRARETPERRPLTRPAFVAALAAAVFAVGTGVAFANDVNPFTRIAAFVGLTAADRARASHDVLDPAIVAQLDSAEEDEARTGLSAVSPGDIVRDSIRFLKQLPSGRDLYVATTTTDELTLILTDDGELSVAVAVPSLPERDAVTVARTGGGNAGVLPLYFGIAQDGVSAVSFKNENGYRQTTVPVTDNVWAYEGYAQALGKITVHYADGTSQTATHPGYPCLAPFFREGDNTPGWGPILCASAPTHIWYAGPDRSGANTDTISWFVRYFDPARAK